MYLLDATICLSEEWNYGRIANYMVGWGTAIAVVQIAAARRSFSGFTFLARFLFLVLKWTAGRTSRSCGRNNRRK